jgi:hypothetical protein
MKIEPTLSDLLDCFSKLNTKLVFTLERQKDRKINFLDITIYREQSELSTDIYRKPTFTDVIIPNDSCHPKEHKMAAVRYLYNRINSYQLSSDSMQKENNTTIQILTSNKYDALILNTMNNRKVKTKCARERKWVKYTYVGKETRIITKHSKNTTVNISFTTNNTIGKILASQHQRTANKYDIRGVYQLTRPTCNMKYIGQTD